jgi:hypothetical protein
MAHRFKPTLDGQAAARGFTRKIFIPIKEHPGFPFHGLIIGENPQCLPRHLALTANRISACPHRLH